jgi:hypothetical protein
MSPQTILRIAASGVALAVVVSASSLQAARTSSSNRLVGQPRDAAYSLAHSQAAQPSRLLLDQYCVPCHSDRLRTAGLSLERLDPQHAGADAATWEKVVRKVRSGAMPPAGRPRPEPAAADAFVSALEMALDREAARLPNPGSSVVHRLNRAEYANVIRDVLAVEVDARALLPADDSSYGFDNIADALSVSPGLLDRYLAAARKISRLAVGDPTLHSTERYMSSFVLLQNDRMNEDLPFGSRGGLAVRHYFPLDGEYVLRVWMQRGYANVIRGITELNSVDVRVDSARMGVFTVGGNPAFAGGLYGGGTTQGAKPDLEVRIPVKAGTRSVAVSFVEKDIWAVEGMGPAHMPPRNISFAAGKSQMGIDGIEIDGPFSGTGPGDTPSRRRIFTCYPASQADESTCAKTILMGLARRAYRRPVTDADVDPLLRMYTIGREDGAFEAGIQRALERILVSLDFLFRRERNPAGAAAGAASRVSDVDLASRLSFFLWSSVPDDALLDAAERGRLRDPKVLDRQVRRMLADRKAKALTDNFGGQWLQFRNLRVVSPDPSAFPAFDDNLRDAFQQETELFLESQVRADRPVTELLTANYTFVNERLARHYGIRNVYGPHFRRVAVDDTRGGLLGQGGILTVTSYPTRTSPVLRGKWLLENVLGSPPPPPPPNVEGLPENGKNGKLLSMREQMEQHRKNPVCASCHARMDPLGFSLENYDGIGRWRRTSEADAPIDASGVLPDGTRFAGPQELRALLLQRRAEFVATVTEKLMTYALGRGVAYFDMPAIRTITREAAVHDSRWSAIIGGIVRSMPFQMRRTDP